MARPGRRLQSAVCRRANLGEPWLAACSRRPVSQRV